MATFKNRALTIATVGMLSAAPITIATNGILQIPEAVAPPVEIPVPSQGGGARVGERFVLEYAKRHEHWSALTLELFSQTAFDHVHEIPVAFEHRSALDVYMWGDGVHHRSGHFFARSNIVVKIESSAKARQNKIQFLHLTGEFLLDSKVYARFASADGAHDCTIATPVTLHSATRFEHTRVDDVVRPVTHTHVSDCTATLDGEATTLLYHVPIVERTVSHEATSD